MIVIFWIVVGLMAAGMLFVLVVDVLARISDLRMQRMVRDMQEQQRITIRGSRCGHM